MQLWASPTSWVRLPKSDLLAFQLPPKYAPGTHLMSKWILNDKQVISLIVKSTIGQHAETEYDARLTEWTNYTRSDVFYCPHSRAKAKTLPPVLIEVQYTANGAFFHRLNEYAPMIRKHQPLSPIVIIFCIHNSTEEFKDLTYDFDTMPFAKELHRHGWAQRCCFISRETIAAHLNQTIAAHLNQHPLHPLAAIGHFLIQRKTSILNITQNDDPTIQLLYKIAKRVFEDEARKEDARQDAIVTICSKAKSQFNQATLLLEEDVPDSQARKRTIDCLADGLQLMDHLCKKYTTASSFASSSSTPPPPTTTEPALKPNDDWQFVDEYRKEHGTKMSWVQCYQAGKNARLFQT